MSSLPQSVLVLKHCGLEIKSCKDTASYKKLVPALLEMPDSFLATADDDIYYPRHWLETLVNAWSGDNKQLIVHRAFVFGETPEGLSSPRKNWKPLTAPKDSIYIYPTTGGGILYPPQALHKDATNEELFLKLSPRADDIWFFWMARRNGCSFRKTPLNFKLIYWVGSQDEALYHENDAQHANDEKTKNMLRHFGPPYP